MTSSLHHTAYTTISIKFKVSSDTKRRLWRKTDVRRFWNRCGVRRVLVVAVPSSELKEQFHSGRTPVCRWCNLADGTLSSKPWYFISSHRRWSDLLCSRRCLHDHPHQTLEKEALQYTPQLVKTIVKEIMKVESSKQIRSLACCSMTIDSKSR